MDRFEQGRPDKQDEIAYCHCDATGLEIFRGEYYLQTSDGSVLKDDINVLMEYFDVQRKIAGEDIV